MSRNSTTEEFIRKAHKVHGTKYGYRKVVYLSAWVKVRITCPKHGDFLQAPANHLCGYGCWECGIERRMKTRTHSSLSKFIKKATQRHHGKYSYKKIQSYKNGKTKVEIVCPIHGSFWQSPDAHQRGQGCPLCGHVNTGVFWRDSQNDFIRKAINKHGKKYTYEKVKYEGSQKPVCITCPKHGDFWQRPDSHINHAGCPSCAFPLKALGLSQESPEYKCWHGMLDRCNNPNNPSYKSYGGRGIRVCDRWNPAKGGSFTNFFKDMGQKPNSEASLDRINPDGDYSPENCQWANKRVQAHNIGKYAYVSLAEIRRVVQTNNAAEALQLLKQAIIPKAA